MEITAESRFLGAFLGCAVGDALGAQIEFAKWPAIEKRYGPAGVTSFDGPGHITDDTQMALFTAEGLIRGSNRGIERGCIGDPPYPRIAAHSGGIPSAYLRWLSTQDDAVRLPFGGRGWLVEQPELQEVRAPGNTCLNALRSGGVGTLEEPINNSKGCGGVMRVHPIGLVAREDSFNLGAEAAAITHGHTTGYLAAGAFAAIVADIAAGTSVVTGAQRTLDRLQAWRIGIGETTRAIEAAMTMAIDEPHPDPAIIGRLGEGWVAEEALAISLYCALTARDARTGIVAAVNHSGDSDSTGAITGAILGTLHGVESVPRDWIENLAERRVVETVARDLLAQFPEDDDGSVAYDLVRYPPN